MAEFDTEQKNIYPMMPLRDIVVFPHMVAPLVVGRERSIKALEEAMAKRSEIFLSTQKDASEDDPTEESVHVVGTVATVMQLLRLPDGTIKALVEGKRRARIVRHLPSPDYFVVQVQEEPVREDGGAEAIAFVREIQTRFKEYVKYNKKVPGEVIKSLARIESPAKFVDVLAAHLPLSVEEKQKILECFGVLDRLEQVLALIHKEIEIAELEETIRSRVKKKIDKTQRDYYLAEQIRAIQKEMGTSEDGTSEVDELERAIREKNLPEAARAKLEQEFKKLKMMPAMSAEATVVRNYIDCILSLPWREKTEEKIDIGEAERILEQDHYGLLKPKERILEYLAVQAQVEKIKGPILCLVGPPGVGKTSLCKSVARAMGRKFVRLSLGGVRDEAEIRGHRRTYIGAMPGRIIQGLKTVASNNPVFMFDEIDKVGSDYRGDPSSALLEVLDPAQNSEFTDHYLNMPFDLSKVMFITTANMADTIPAPLYDRMEVIRLAGYTLEEKVEIARRYLVPRQLEENGITSRQLQLDDAMLARIITNYTREAGLRNLEREIGTICRKIARKVAEGSKGPFAVSERTLSKYLGPPKFTPESETEIIDQPGMATGLAWTEVGGEILYVEVSILKGRGNLTLTGQLGEVMKESAQAALSFCRSRLKKLKLGDNYFDEVDIHVHVPAGAIPKDGPSAGVTIATAMYSALARKKVRQDVAMTGEVTLRGRVLPIGGLKEKALAALRAGITTVIIPDLNKKDLVEIPEDLRKKITFVPVKNMDRILSIIFRD